jgi:hypothetical protein
VSNRMGEDHEVEGRCHGVTYSYSFFPHTNASAVLCSRHSLARCHSIYEIGGRRLAEACPSPSTMAEERESEITLVAGIESSPLMMEVLLVATCCGRGSSRAGKKECKQGEGAREVVACRPLGSRALRSRCGAGDSPRFFLLQPREIACVVVKIHLRARFSTVGSTCDLISVCFSFPP